MIDFKFGDVVLVSFPFSDQTNSKKRPAVVVSSPAYHHSRPDLILMAIASHANLSSRLGEVTIHDWQAAGLLKASLIKPVVTTIERSLVIKKRRQLSAVDVQALVQCLALIFGPTYCSVARPDPCPFLHEAVFTTIWDNADDSEYDRL